MNFSLNSKRTNSTVKMRYQRSLDRYVSKSKCTRFENLLLPEYQGFKAMILKTVFLHCQYVLLYQVIYSASVARSFFSNGRFSADSFQNVEKRVKVTMKLRGLLLKKFPSIQNSMYPYVKFVIYFLSLL